MVLVEARVFSGDHGVLEVGRDLAQRNEVVVLVVGLAVNEGLHAPLHVDRGRGRVDPLRSDEGERGERPCSDEREAETEKKVRRRCFRRIGLRGALVLGGTFQNKGRALGEGTRDPLTSTFLQTQIRR